ncbi:MAG: sensor domain-containing diguanylate cyclase [Thermoleophilia bacterium]|nr:sensor domain-containing diguanylate cyclase [Thermoleophilia bacterium]
MGAPAVWLAVTCVVVAGTMLAVALVLARVARPHAAAERSRPRRRRAQSPGGSPRHAPSPVSTRADGARADAAESELLRARQLAALVGTLDLEELLPRVLEAATAASFADAAALALRGDDGQAALHTHNLSADETPPLGGMETDSRAQGVAIHYRYPTSRLPPEHIERIATGLVVPLDDGEQRIGQLAVYWRGERHEPSDGELSALADFAMSCARAIGNARRFERSQRLAITDGLTGVYNRRYFHETLAREVKRAQRYGRALALLVFDLDGFKRINDEHGHLAGDEALAELGERLRAVVRAADVACRTGGDEFAVILPEARHFDAEQLLERLVKSLSERPAGRAGRLRLSAGAAELRHDEDGLSLFQRADEQLMATKRRGRLIEPDRPSGVRSLRFPRPAA